MFEKIGRFSVHYRYQITVFWLAVVVIVTLLAPDLGRVSISDQAGFLGKNAPSVKAAMLMDKYFTGRFSSSSAVLVFDVSNGSVHDPAIRSYLADFTSWIKTGLDPDVIGIVFSPVDSRLAPRLISPDGHVALISVGIKGSYEDERVISVLKELEKRVERAPSGIKGYVTGVIPITNAYKTAILESAKKTTRITVFLVIIILLAIYRSPVLPMVSLVTIGISYGISRGICAWLALHGMVTSSMTDLFLVVLLFGAGTDYCLFIISRFREYMADDLPPSESAALAVGRVGETIASSVGTVIVAVIAISFVSLKLFSSTGPSLAIGLAVTFFAVMTLTPAILSILGKLAFWPGKPLHAHDSVFWSRIAGWVTVSPWRTMLMAILVLLPLAIYGQKQILTFDMLIDLPEDDPAKAGFNVTARAFGAGGMQPVDLLTVDPGGTRSPSGISQIAATTRQLLNVRGVSDVDSLTRPLGRYNPYAVDDLRVERQLSRMAGIVSANRDVLASHAKLDPSFPAETDARLKAIQVYLADLTKVFPGINSDINYQTAFESLARLQESGRNSFVRLKVAGQMSLIVSRLKDNSSYSLNADTGVILSDLNVLNDYMTGLAEKVPGSGRLNGYADAMTSLQKLRAKLTALNSTSGVTKKINMMRDREELVEMRSLLVASLDCLEREFKGKMPDAIYNPAASTPEEQKSLASVISEMDSFAKSALALGKVFVDMPDGYYIPMELVSGSERELLTTLLNTYTSPAGDAARYKVFLVDEPYSPSAMDTVVRLNSLSLPFKTYQTGGTAILADLRDAMNHDTRLMWILVSGGIIVVLFLLLRSVTAPLYLMATIVLSYNATMGITCLVFNTCLHKSLTWFVPFFMFVLLMALGMDYNIFLMGRVKEEVANNGTRNGVRRAVLQTGGIITSAGIIMAGTFTAMMSSSLLGLVQLGFAVTVGILLDTFIVRTTLVPSIVVILGRWNWLPGRDIR